ncbi:uncharacterized protein BROUX77_007080 [Berkeleyomyces rouxiae]|uniref:uncharacterized protein n=1 Tax=Berkeleyomyces rouxiae TaxID=2035830 RepID=UPI003B795BBE
MVETRSSAKKKAQIASEDSPPDVDTQTVKTSAPADLPSSPLSDYSSVHENLPQILFLHDQIAELTRQPRDYTVRDKSPLSDHPKDPHVDDAHARASLVTVQSMNEMRWSFKVSQFAILSSALQWATWCQFVLAGFAALDIEPSDLVYVDNTPRILILQDLRATLSVSLQKAVRLCTTYEEIFSVLKAKTADASPIMQREFQAKLQTCDFEPGETLSKFLKRYESLLETAEDMSICVSSDGRLNKIRGARISMFP